MKTRIKKSLLDSIEPGAEDIVIKDTELDGFQAKITPKGKVVFQFYYRNQEGQRRRPKIGELGRLTVEEARKIGKEWSQAIARGEDPSAERKAKRVKGETLADFWVEFEAHSKSRWKPKTRINHSLYWSRHIKPILGNKPLDRITKADVSRFRGKMSDKAVTANRCVSLLKTAFNQAIEWELHPGPNPCTGIKPYKEQPRERFLSPDELRVLFLAIDIEESLGGKGSVPRAGESQGRGGKGMKEARSRGITPHAAGLFRLLVFTGARRGEIKDCQWDFVNFETRKLELPDSKTGRKTITLNQPALDELARLWSIRTQPTWVIEGRIDGQPLDNASKPWARVLRRANGLWAHQEGRTQEDAAKASEGAAFASGNDSEEELPAPLAEGRFSGLRIHDLRHSFASFSIGGGIPIEVIGKTLGHRNVTTTARYAHLADDPIRRAVDDVGERMSEIIRGKRGKVEEIG